MGQPVAPAVGESPTAGTRASRASGPSRSRVAGGRSCRHGAVPTLGGGSSTPHPEVALETPDLTLRTATEDDLAALVALLADDPLGALRERRGGPVADSYREAFRAIASDPNHQLMVADRAGTVVGVLQLSFLPHLTYEGGWRAQIEGVRVAKEHRSEGVGRTLVEAAVERARERGCHLVQLTTDRRRPAALKFYRSLGFEASHEGLKLHLDGMAP